MPLLHIDLDREAPDSLMNQVYGQIREMILAGKLEAGEKLPSTRELAGFLNVSRNVVTTAYELLNVEGYLEGRHGSGSYVAQGVNWEMRPAALQPVAGDIGANRESDVLPGEECSYHDWQSRGRLHDCWPDGRLVDFRSGIPALELVPRKHLAMFTHRAWFAASDKALGYGHPAGDPELRRVIAAYLEKTRGVVCGPDQMIITSGAVQGLALIAQALVQPGDEVLIEDPSNRDIAGLFRARGARVTPVPVDELGMRTGEIPPGSNPALTVLTPSHQFPLGGILPIQRRIELVRRAQETKGFIVEDDYDSEFRYEGPPVSSLQGLDPQRVLYLGTFSKILLPALRLGYMVLPRPLLATFTELKRLDDLHSSTLNQMALARFIREGLLARHTAKMKKVYRKKRNLLITSLQRAFPQRLRIHGASTGLHLVAELPGTRFDVELVERLREHGVAVYPVEAHAVVKGRHCAQIILGFGHLPPAAITAGVRRMKEVLECKLD